VAGLVKIHVIHATSYWTADNVADGVQNFMICVEMVIASVIHIFCFSHKEWATEERTPVWNSFLQVMNLIDVVHDHRRHFIPKKIRDQIFIPKNVEVNVDEIEIDVKDEKGDAFELKTEKNSNGDTSEKESKEDHSTEEPEATLP